MPGVSDKPFASVSVDPEEGIERLVTALFAAR
jgi:hypothetical protein